MTGTEGVSTTPGTMQTTHLNPLKIKMNSSTSYRSWIGFNDNSDGGIAVYSVACYLSQGLQVDVFAFEHDAYLYLVDQAEGLTDEQRIELGQLAELSDRDAFWDLFNKSVSPLTSYRIESHTLRRHYCAGASSDLSSDFISCDSSDKPVSIPGPAAWHDML